MNTTNELPVKIYQKMMQEDYFSQWLGLQLEVISDGYCKMNFEIKREMLNGFGSVHGGILFSASDSAFAFACNTHGRQAVALEVSISFIKPANEGDVLFVEAKNIHLGNKIGIYEVRIMDIEGVLVSLFKGTSYRKGPWDLEQ